MLREGKWLHKGMLLIAVCALRGDVWSPAAAYEVIEVKDGGTVTGVVKFVGTPPPPAQLEITRDEKACGTGTRPSEAFVVSGTGGIQNVVVSLENFEKGKAQSETQENPKLVQETVRLNKGTKSAVGW